MCIRTIKIFVKMKQNLPDADQESVGDTAYLQWHSSSFF